MASVFNAGINGNDAAKVLEALKPKLEQVVDNNLSNDALIILEEYVKNPGPANITNQDIGGISFDSPGVTKVYGKGSMVFSDKKRNHLRYIEGLKIKSSRIVPAAAFFSVSY